MPIQGQVKHNVPWLVDAQGRIVGYRGERDAEYELSATGGGSGFVPNAFSGQELSVPPLSTTGANAANENLLIEARFIPFAGNLYNDPLISFGYNAGQGGVRDASGPEKFGGSWTIENNYEAQASPGAQSSGTSSAGGASTLTDSGKTWGVNQWVGCVLYNVTTGQSARITSNTATQLTVGTSMSPVNAAGHSYQILEALYEWYHQFAGEVGAGSRRSIRPLFQIISKTPLEYLPNEFSVTAATNANPCVLTISATNPGISPSRNQYLYVRGMTGNWAFLNGMCLAVSAVGGANNEQLTITGLNTTGLGAYPGGGFVSVAPIGSQLIVNTPPNQGILVQGAAWDANYATPTWLTSLSGGMRLGPGVFEGSAGFFTELAAHNPGSGSASNAIRYTFGGIQRWELNASSGGFFQFNSRDSLGANSRTAFVIVRTTTYDEIVFNNDGGAQPRGLVNIGNVGRDAGRVLLRFVRHASQTADIIRVFNSDETTLRWFVDANDNWVPRVSAGATGDTNGFFYVPSVAGIPTGVPANLTGNYANAVPMRVDSTNNRAYFYVGGAWRFAALT